MTITPENVTSKLEKYIDFAEKRKDKGTDIYFVQNLGMQLPYKTKNPFVFNVANVWASFDIELYKKYIKLLLKNPDMFEVSNSDLRESCKELQRSCSVFNLNKIANIGIYISFLEGGAAKFLHVKGFPTIPTYEQYVKMSKI